MFAVIGSKNTPRQAAKRFLESFHHFRAFDGRTIGDDFRRTKCFLSAERIRPLRQRER
jgi:hypothetical protein